MPFTVSEVALLRRSKSMTGRTSASDKVNLSRQSWVSSFLTCARTRFILYLLLRGLAFLPHLFDDGDENIFQRVRFFMRLQDIDPRGRQAVRHIPDAGLRIIIDDHMQTITE